MVYPPFQTTVDDIEWSVNEKEDFDSYHFIMDVNFALGIKNINFGFLPAHWCVLALYSVLSLGILLEFPILAKINPKDWTKSYDSLKIPFLAFAAFSNIIPFPEETLIAETKAKPRAQLFHFAIDILKQNIPYFGWYFVS